MIKKARHDASNDSIDPKNAVKFQSKGTVAFGNRIFGVDGKQDCPSLPAIFSDSPKLIPQHPRNSDSGLKQSRPWLPHFIRNCYRGISKGAQANPASLLLAVLIALLTIHLSLVTPVHAAETPKRIISLAPAITEILFALGLEDNIIGVTSYCDYPESAKKKPKVGGMSNPSLEAVVSLKPDIVVMTTDGNPKEFEDSLHSLKIKTYVFRARELAALPQGIRDMGLALGVDERAGRLSKEIGVAISKFRNTKDRTQGTKKKILFIIWPEPLIVAGPGTAMDDAISLLGHDNIASSARSAYPKYSIEEVIRQSPDVIFVGRQMGEDIREVTRGFLDKMIMVPAVRNSRVFYVGDGLYRMGPRVVKGIEELAECLK